MKAATARPLSAAAYSIFSASPFGKRVLMRFVATPVGRPLLEVADFVFVFTDESWNKRMNVATYFSVLFWHRLDFDAYITPSQPPRYR